jgi:hypothetical protein
MKLKTIIIELAILVAVFIATWLSAFWFTGAHQIDSPTLDIGLYDTYLVLPWLTIIVQPFLMLITLIYFVKEGFYRYQRKFQNIILLTSNFIFIIYLNKFFSLTGFMGKGGWTIYPPLSAIPKENKPYQDILVIHHIEQILFFILIIFMLILVISAILTGKNWKIKPYEPKA